MVELLCTRISQIAPHADALLSSLYTARRERIRGMPPNQKNTLHALAGGLLLQSAFGREKLESDLVIDEAHGKPYVKGARPFSLSHAGDYAALALADSAVGVDVELVRTLDVQAIAARFFHMDEQAYLAAANDPLGAFFTIWTRKESFLKACGLGFSVSPASFSVLQKSVPSLIQGDETPFVFHMYGDLPPAYRLCVCHRIGEDCAPLQLVSF